MNRWALSEVLPLMPLFLDILNLGCGYSKSNSASIEVEGGRSSWKHSGHKQIEVKQIFHIFTTRNGLEMNNELQIEDIFLMLVVSTA